MVPGVRGAKNEAGDLRVGSKLLSQSEEDGNQFQHPDKTTVPKAAFYQKNGPFAKCKSYRNAFWLDWDGQMELCSFMNSCRTKPFEYGMRAAWEELLEKIY